MAGTAPSDLRGATRMPARSAAARAPHKRLSSPFRVMAWAFGRAPGTADSIVMVRDCDVHLWHRGGGWQRSARLDARSADLEALGITESFESAGWHLVLEPTEYVLKRGLSLEVLKEVLVHIWAEEP